MARPLRIELAGGLYHVTSRGDRRESIYFNDGDRERWLSLLGHVCERFNWVCQAYCLMDNHYHILVETIEGNLSKGMRQLNGVYTQYVNREYNRVGHVFQGRYKGMLVEKENYLLELSRYIVLNPVRAGMVKEAAEWDWSSYPSMIGEQERPRWLQTDWVLSQFSVKRKIAIRKYIDFIRAGVGLPSLWDNLKQQIYLGDDRFVEKMQKEIKQSGDIKEIPRAQRRPKATSLGDYLAYEDSRQGMVVAYKTGDYTMKEIADVFGIHYSTVSRTVKQSDQIWDCKT